MKKKVNVQFAAVFAAALITLAAGGCKDTVSSVSNNEQPPSGSTFIQFENKSAFSVHLYTNPTSRDNNETPFASVDANGTSDAAVWSAGNAVFFITYLLDIDGVAIPYAPAGEAGYVYGLVYENKTTAIPIPPLSEKLNEQQMASPVTDKVYVKIQNASYSALEFFQGASPLYTREDAQKTVNAQETRTYLIQSGSTASYSFRRNILTTLNFPFGMTQFEAGHLYSFVYEQGDAVTLASDKTLSVAAAGALAAPSNIQASAVSNSSIRISWSAAPGAVSYKLYRTENLYGEFVVIAATGSTTYTDTGLAEGQTYYYKVSSVKGTEEQMSAFYVSAVPRTPTMTAPLGLTAEAASSSSVILSWSDVPGAVVYRVYQGATAGTVNEYVGASASPVITITGLAAGTTYYFSVSALDSTNTEGPKAQAVSVIPVTRLAVPAGFAALPQSENSIRLSWDAVAGAAAYEVFRAAAASGPYASIGRVPVALYTDTGLASGVYYYKLRAWSADNTDSSALSVSISGMTATSTLFAPNVTANATPLGTIVLAWNTINGATSYSVYRSTSESGPYAAIASVSGVSFTDDDVFGGTRYYYKVSATNGTVVSADSAVVNALAVLAAPGGVNALSLSTNSIRLTWNAVSGASGYHVYRAASASGDYAKITASPVSALTYTDTGLNSASAYYYKVRAQTEGGIESALSTQTSAATQAEIASAPSGLSAAAQSASSIALNWNRVTGATGYTVYRSSSEAGSYAKITASPITGVTYIDTGLNAATSYYYKVSAINSDGIEGAQSSSASARTPAVALGAPTGLTAAALSTGSIQITWNTVSGASGYNLYVSTSASGDYAKLNTSLLSGTSFTHTGLSEATSYYYKVATVNSDNVEGAQSGYVTARTPAAVLAAPDGVSATAQSASSIALSWNRVTGATGYNVYRSSSAAGDYAKITASPVTGATYTDTGLNAATSYYYKVSAINSDGIEGAQSSSASARTPAVALGAPTGLTAAALSTGSIQITWNTVSGASGYNLYVSTSASGDYAKLNTSLLSGTSFTHTGLSEAAVYYYKVAAVNIDGVEGAQSGYVTARTPAAVLAAPDGVSATAQSTSSITVQWSAVTGASGYTVYRASSATGDYAEITASPVTGITYTDTGLNAATSYYYKVSAINSDGIEGAQSSSASARTPAVVLGAPTGLTAAALSTGSIQITWNTVSGATGYNLYASSSASGDYAKLNTSLLSGTSFTHTGLSEATAYYYKVATVNSDDVAGAQSGYASAQTLLSAPGGVTLTAGNGQLTASWSAVAGADQYEVYYSTTTTMPGTASRTVSTTSATITGLTNGTAYYVWVKAKNTSGAESVSTVVSGKPSIAGLYQGAVDDAHKIGSQNLAASIAYLSSNAVTEHEYFIVLEADESASNISLSYSGKIIGITIMGTGAERTVNNISTATFFTVGTGVTLTLDDNITLVGRRVNVSDTGELVMNSGSKITGNNGVGVYVYSNGTFTMNGGEISENTAAALGGGGVYVGLYGTFTMNGGEISENTAALGGGGVYVDSYGTFTMNGGTISNNKTSLPTTYGGGVYVYTHGTFTMNGGAISSNTAITGGGGVYSEDTFLMKGGTISGNTAAYGGGVCIGNGSFSKLPVSGNNSGIIYGSEVSGTDASDKPLKNIATSNCAAVYTSHSGSRSTTAGQTDQIDTTTGKGLSTSGDAPFGQ